MEKKNMENKWIFENFWEDQRGMGCRGSVLIIVENQRHHNLMCFV